jgi:hypothetical protein
VNPANGRPEFLWITKTFNKSGFQFRVDPARSNGIASNALWTVINRVSA